MHLKFNGKQKTKKQCKYFFGTNYVYHTYTSSVTLKFCYLSGSLSSTLTRSSSRRSCGLYIGLPWSWENRFFAYPFFWWDWSVACLCHQMKQKTHIYIYILDLDSCISSQLICLCPVFAYLDNCTTASILVMEVWKLIW